MNYTRDRFFVDTNVFVYAFDPSAGAKWKASTGILDALWDHQTGVVSTQVLQELFVSLTQKVKNPVSHRTAKGIISDLLNLRGKGDVVQISQITLSSSFLMDMGYG